MDLMTYMLAQKGGGGGSDLPVVTPADDGKILGVVSGAWNTVNPDTVIDLPMTLRVGTQESPVYLSELDEGLYAINGKYYILRNSEPFETDYNIIALVSKEEGLDRAKVKVITADDVTDYDIKENGGSIAVYTNKIVTEKYLSNNHYVIETDLAGYMPKISNSEGDKVVTSNANGSVSESNYTMGAVFDNNISPNGKGVVTGHLSSDYIGGYLVTTANDSGYDITTYTGYSLAEVLESIDNAYETGYSKLNPISDAEGGRIVLSTSNGSIQESEETIEGIKGSFMHCFNSLPTERKGKLVIAGNDTQSLGTTQIDPDLIITGYPGSALTPGNIVIARDNTVVDTSAFSLSDLATNEFVGSIPQDSSATTIIDYIDEITTPIQSISNTPTAIATFNASALSMPSLTVGIEATQDLHGYDNPWPAGGGKNKFDQDTAYASYKQSDGSFRITGNAVTLMKNYIPQSLVGQQITISIYFDLTKEASPNGVRIACNIGGTETESSRIEANEKKTVSLTVTPTATTDYWYITYGNTGANYFTFKDCQLEVGSTATAFAPYENICPFSGWSAVNWYRTGINAWDEEWIYSGGAVKSKNNIILKPNTTYFFVAPTGTEWANIYCKDANGNTILIGNPGYSFTTPSNTAYAVIQCGGNYGNTYKNDISINYPSTDTSYHAYSGSTYTTALKDANDQPLTCYGGTLSNENGVQRLANGMGIVDLGTLNWNKGNMNTAGTGRIFFIPLTASSPMKQPSDNGLCEALKYNPFSNWIAGQWERQILNGITVTGSSALVVCVQDIYETASDFKTAMSGVMFAYELATPQQISQDNLAIATQEGTNNLWADSGKVLSGEYRASRYQDIYTYGALPSVMSSDNGKLLQVVNGSWQAVDLDANSTSY